MAKFIGDDFSARDEQGQRKVRIATVFPYSGTIVTLPGVHASQRQAYVASLNQKLLAEGKPPLNE